MVWINVIPDEQKLIADWRTSHGYTCHGSAGQPIGRR